MLCAVLGILLLATAAGCQTLTPQPAPANGTAKFEDGNVDPTAVSDKGRTHGEPNDSFGSALVAVPDDSGVVRLQGTIEALGDLDVFDLGAMEGGDGVIVDLNTLNGPLDVSIALFDDQERLFIDNDDRDAEPRLLDSYVDEVVRHASDRYYLVVGASAFAGSFENSIGSYRATVTMQRDGQVPPPVRQTLLLDFDGGEPDAPAIPDRTVEPFDAGAISPLYAGQTETIKNVILETVRENFEDVAVDIVTSDDPPPDHPYSTIFFGNRNPIAYGIAEGVDHYNSDYTDEVVVYTESFAPSAFRTQPSAEGMGVAIGNIASHEAGHILGLNHVNDSTALMDTVSPPDAFLLDQDFKLAPLSAQILPIGAQDALLLLAEILGLR